MDLSNTGSEYGAKEDECCSKSRFDGQQNVLASFQSCASIRPLPAKGAGQDLSVSVTETSHEVDATANGSDDHAKDQSTDPAPEDPLAPPAIFHLRMTIDEIWRLRPMWRAFAICNKPLDPAWPAVRDLVASVAGPEAGYWGKMAQNLLHEGLPVPSKKGKKVKPAEWDNHIFVEALILEERAFYAAS